MKEILITGGSSGIGRATSLAAAQSGWRVIACGRDQSRLDALSREHAQIRTLAFDVANIEECRQALNTVSPDVILLNAGTCEYVDIDDWNIELFRRVLDANFFGVVTLPRSSASQPPARQPVGLRRQYGPTASVHPERSLWREQSGGPLSRQVAGSRFEGSRCSSFRRSRRGLSRRR